MTKKEWEQINERRNRYIDKKNAENEIIALKNGLSYRQISAIEEICGLRHELHCTDARDIVSENDNISELLLRIWKIIDDNQLPEIEQNLYEEDWITDCDWYNIYADADRQEWYDKANGDKSKGYCLWYDYACEVCADLINTINNQIEDWLIGIDKRFGTSYCPSGYQRLY